MSFRKGEKSERQKQQIPIVYTSGTINYISPLCMFLLFTSCFFAVVAAYCLRAYIAVALPSQRAAGRIKHTLTRAHTWQMFWEHCFQILWRSLSAGALVAGLSVVSSRATLPAAPTKTAEMRNIRTAFVDVNVIAQHYAERRTHLRK